MPRHIIDHPIRRNQDGRLVLTLGAAKRRMELAGMGQNATALYRRLRGPFNPGLRMAAFARIERGYRP